MTLYEKRGKRYYPIAEYTDLHSSSYPYGDYLFRVRAGCTEITPLREQIDESRPEFAALAAEMKDAMLAAMNEANKSRPQTPEVLTPAQQAAFETFRKAMNGLIVFRGASLHDIVDAGLSALKVGK